MTQVFEPWKHLLSYSKACAGAGIVVAVAARMLGYVTDCCCRRRFGRLGRRGCCFGCCGIWWLRDYLECILEVGGGNEVSSVSGRCLGGGILKMGRKKVVGRVVFGMLLRLRNVEETVWEVGEFGVGYLAE